MYGDVKFKIDQSGSKANGTSFKGEMIVPYYKIVEVFGEPKKVTDGDGKTSVSWTILYKDILDRDMVATIYDWKTDVEYTDNNEWNVGGNSMESFWVVKELLGVS